MIVKSSCIISMTINNCLIIAETECAIGEEQCGFRQGRGCLDQVFALRQVCEKYLTNGKDVF